MDALATLKSCIQTFPRPTQSVVPHAPHIWNSLKFEVRNGETSEAIDAALASITALSSRLDGYPTERLDAMFIRDFVQLSMVDCAEALASPAYAKSSGRLITSVARGSVRAFNLVMPTALDMVKSRLREIKDILHVRDLVWLVNSLLETRYDLMQAHDGDSTGPATDELHELDPLVSGSLESIYLPLYDTEKVEKPGPDEIAVLKEVMRGLGELLRQRGRDASSPGQAHLCSPAQTDRILGVLLDRVVYPFRSSLEPDVQAFRELAGEASRILRGTIQYHPRGFDYLVRAALSSLRGVRSHPASPGDMPGAEAPESLADSAQKETSVAASFWRDPTLKQMVMLKEKQTRIAFIGCSTVIPEASPVGNLVLLVSTLLHELFLFLDRQCSFQASTIVLSGVYAAVLNFRGACLDAGLLEPHGGAPSMPRNWMEQFSTLDSDTKQASRWTHAGGTGASTDGQSQPIFGEYLGICLDAVARLYRRATIDVTNKDGVLEKDAGSDFCAHLVDPSTGKGDHRQNSELRRGGVDTADLNLYHQDKYLHQLASLASFVVRGVAVSEQHRLGLP